MEGSLVVGHRWRPRKTTNKIIKKELDLNGLSIDKVYNKIHGIV